MLPVVCIGCHKAVETSMEGLHPFIMATTTCSVYPNTSWAARRGCAFNATFVRRTKAKVNPLKASKRGGR